MWTLKSGSLSRHPPFVLHFLREIAVHRENKTACQEKDGSSVYLEAKNGPYSKIEGQWLDQPTSHYTESIRCRTYFFLAARRPLLARGFLWGSLSFNNNFFFLQKLRSRSVAEPQFGMSAVRPTDRRVRGVADRPIVGRHKQGAVHLPDAAHGPERVHHRGHRVPLRRSFHRGKDRRKEYSSNYHTLKQVGINEQWLCRTVRK